MESLSTSEGGEVNKENEININNDDDGLKNNLEAQIFLILCGSVESTNGELDNLNTFRGIFRDTYYANVLHPREVSISRIQDQINNLTCFVQKQQLKYRSELDTLFVLTERPNDNGKELHERYMKNKSKVADYIKVHRSHAYSRILGEIYSPPNGECSSLMNSIELFVRAFGKFDKWEQITMFNGLLQRNPPVIYACRYEDGQPIFDATPELLAGMDLILEGSSTHQFKVGLLKRYFKGIDSSSSS